MVGGAFCDPSESARILEPPFRANVNREDGNPFSLRTLNGFLRGAKTPCGFGRIREGPWKGQWGGGEALTVILVGARLDNTLRIHEPAAPRATDGGSKDGSTHH